ncbi:hypothetical protein BJ165DRAFT_771580 [Panaeolus papilionaceus]|nr:hypothetical protein BJ165DRAFT_771580 [Panaeolus papilionaceus]
MDLTPPGAPTLTPRATFHGRSMALGVVGDPGNIVVGGRRSVGWGGALTEMVSHLDMIGVGYGGRKEDRMVLDTGRKHRRRGTMGGKCGMKGVSAVVRATHDLSEIVIEKWNFIFRSLVYLKATPSHQLCSSCFLYAPIPPHSSFSLPSSSSSTQPLAEAFNLVGIIQCYSTVVHTLLLPARV